MDNLKQLNKDNFYNLNKLINNLEEDILNENSLWYTKKNNYINKLKENYKKEFDKVPAIFNIINNNDSGFNIVSCARLKFMIKKAEEVFENNITEHDASICVGSKLVDEIVKPQLNKTK